MKLRSFRCRGKDAIGAEIDADLRLIEGFEDMNRLIEAMADQTPAERVPFLQTRLGEPVDPSEIETRAPIVHPVKDVICVGLNYQAHVNESQSMGVHENKEDIHTTYFGKRCDWIRGDGEPVAIHSKVDPEMDYETELVVVIGRGGRAIPRETALSHVFGYSIGNDFSSRRLQRNHKQWFLGKGLDGYTAMGPCILLNESEEHRDFELEGRVNGEIRQSSTTELMIKSIEDIIYEISQGITLVPGDLIFTGTPAGVGAGFQPPRYLTAGDVVQLEVEGIGRLTNPIIEA
ncbi:Fumarylacetoacetate (FAA) hydrolase family protein [anaerobic digester metagenome]|nr:fumarylacetoacetate hydrolase family protein [Clostridiaceae bacterium HFYG-1003]